MGRAGTCMAFEHEPGAQAAGAVGTGWGRGRSGSLRLGAQASWSRHHRGWAMQDAQELDRAMSKEGVEIRRGGQCQGTACAKTRGGEGQDEFRNGGRQLNTRKGIGKL